GDPQGGASVACNLKKRTAKGLVHALQDFIEPVDAIEYLVADSLAIAGVGIEKPEEITFFEQSAVDGSLKNLIINLAAGFDYALIDAPVGVGAIVKALLEASTSYILAINCKAGTVKSLPKLINLAEWLKKNVNPSLTLDGVALTMYDNTSPTEIRIFNHFKSRLPDNFFFNTIIPYDEAFEAASMRSIPVELFEGGKEMARCFYELAREIDSADQEDDSDQIDISDLLIEQGLEAAEDFENDRIQNTLKDMCGKGSFHGAVVADEMGFPLAHYNCPIDPEALAAFTSVLGDSLKKAGSILDQSRANNISLDLNDAEKISMRRFEALNNTYYLLVVSPLEVDNPGEMEVAVTEIIDGLTD
ncbi:MAG: ParA family protein, partial [Proteobacteria bacterium]|nr:ParA family protein [Pseudomonadota bacterium]